MTADSLTKPERSCSRMQSRAAAELVRNEGGCCYCTRRSHIFDTVGRLAACGLDPPQQFPKCVTTPTGFDFDEPAFREGAGRQLARGKR
ncbi:MAG: hypothetical protein ACREO0_15070 [Pseudoxanthomonas sp.]